MRVARTPQTFLAGLLLAFLAACAGSPKAPAEAGAMNVHLVDGPLSGYQELNVHILSVEILGSGGWITLGTPDRTINLLRLVGGVEESLVNGATLPTGHYGQMRLVLGAGNTVKLADGTVQPLTVPSGLQTGIKLVVSFDVAPGTTKDVWIDFDAAHSILVVQAGASGQYHLRPTVWAFDKLVTGSIHGTLTDAAGATPLAGATVYAETLDPTGSPVLARSTVTDANGAYTLDLLPTGATYYVVSQPVTGTTTPKAYGAKASDGFALSAATPVFTYNTAFTAVSATGSIPGAITPLASSAQSDRVQLLQSLTTASGSHPFILRTAMATLGATTETYGFDLVPPGAYTLRGLRTTLALDGTTSTSTSAAQPATVVAGATATANLAL
jgi:hypothetical protein